jgi:hypothetical protein
MTLSTRPEITEDRVEQIRDVIAENPTWNRTKISKHICRLWGLAEFKWVFERNFLQKYVTHT